MGDGSRQRFLCLVGGKKNIKKTSGVRFFFRVGDILKNSVVFGQKNYRFGKKIYCLLSISEEKIKLKYQFFCLVGDNFIRSEDSSPIEYTESGLKDTSYT